MSGYFQQTEIIHKIVKIKLNKSMMTNCIKQLKSKIQSLSNADSIQAINRAKSEFRGVFRNYHNQNDCQLLLQESLALILLQPKASSLLPIIQKQIQMSQWFDTVMDKIVKKMITSDGSQKIDEPSAKAVRQFLTKQLLKLNNCLLQSIQLAKKDARKCQKILELLVEYFEQNKVAGNFTPILSLCLNLVNINDKINNKMLKNALKILNWCCLQSEQLTQFIFNTLNITLFNCLQEKKVPQQILKLVTCYLKLSGQNQQNTQTIAKVLQILNNKYIEFGADINNQTTIIKSIAQGQLSSSTAITDFYNNLLTQIGNFINIIGQNIDAQMKDKVMYTLLLSKQQKSTQAALKILVQSGHIPSDNKLINNLILKQVLVNCIQYSIQQNLERANQQKTIDYIFSWVQQNLTNPQILNIGYESLRNRNKQDLPQFIPTSALDFFINIIRKNIEEQFQFEFDSIQTQSSINLFCYLSAKIKVSQNGKEKILNFIKILLNLNQSCEPQFKPLLVQKILDVLCMFYDVILEGNRFLLQVMQKKLCERFPMSYVNMKYLASKATLTSSCTSLLLQKGKNSLGFFRQMKNQEEDKLCEIVLLIEKKNKVNWPSDEWMIKGTKKAVQIYGSQWEFEKSLLEGIKKRMKQQNPLENQSYIILINELLNPSATSI